MSSKPLSPKDTGASAKTYILHTVYYIFQIGAIGATAFQAHVAEVFPEFPAGVLKASIMSTYLLDTAEQIPNVFLANTENHRLVSACSGVETGVFEAVVLVLCQ